MRHLNDPASGLLGGVALELTGLLSTAFDVRDVAMGFNDVERRFAVVARVGTQVLVAPLRRIDPLDHDGLKHRLELRHIMAMGSGHDERQRDATTVDQQMALAAIFSPDPWDWGQRLTVPEALSSSPR